MVNSKISRRSFLKSAVLTAGAVVLAGHTSAADAAPTQLAVSALHRRDVLYFSGQQWGPINGWNPYASTNNAMAIAQQDNARVVVWETPYVYNMLDGNQYPLLADGAYTWNSQRTELTFKIKAAAKWSDGTSVTADDAAYTWASHVRYQTQVASNFLGYIQTVEAVDAKTVVVKARLDGDGKAVNSRQLVNYVNSSYVIQQAWTQKMEVRAAQGATSFLDDAGEDFVASGPYTKFYYDDTIVVLIRNDNYWGKDASMWGKLPRPKYLAHEIFVDSGASLLALKAGEVDVSQEYIPNVQDLWLKEKLPISTYMANAPYSLCASLPTVFFNLKAYGLDQIIVRKAIAIAVDYDTIIANAITNQSPTFIQAPRSLMNPTPGEQALYDHDAVKSLQWSGNDIDGAKKLLDDAGITDTDGDGWREYGGKKLTYVATCPNGWVDWQAAIDVVAAAGRSIGIDITTNYPEWADYQAVVTQSNTDLPAGYDIFMMWTDGAGPTQPYSRIYRLMSSEYVGKANNWEGNWGQYSNPAADTWLQAIPNETDPNQLKADYTELVKIYLTDIPSFTVMYRPQMFHTVNESVWTNYPSENDGKNIPPLDLTDGYGVAGLYNLTLQPAHIYIPVLQKS